MVNQTTNRWLTQVGSWEVAFTVYMPAGELESRGFIYNNFH